MMIRVDDSSSRFDEIYRIYKEAFPDQERRTWEGQRRAMENPCYQLLIKEEMGTIIAFLGYWDLPSCIFIEHLATTPACRGKGYGKELVESCLYGVEKPVFLEIEPVVPEVPLTGRRAAFYERLGFYRNSFPYFQQPLKAGDDPCPLWVMSYGKPYTQEQFQPYKEEIYETVYGVGETTVI